MWVTFDQLMHALNATVIDRSFHHGLRVYAVSWIQIACMHGPQSKVQWNLSMITVHVKQPPSSLSRPQAALYILYICYRALSLQSTALYK